MAVYTHANWHVRKGQEAAFEAAWSGLGEVFRALPRPPSGPGTLLRRKDDPLHYVSFGPWPDEEAVAQMRASVAAQEGIRRIMAFCTEADPGTYAAVATA